MLMLINIQIPSDVEIDESVNLDMPQTYFMNVQCFFCPHLCDELADVTDPVPTDSLRQAVAEKHAIHLIGIRMRPKARRRPLSGARKPRKFNRFTQPRNWLAV